MKAGHAEPTQQHLCCQHKKVKHAAMHLLLLL
jgi:hypothetical protein